MATTVRPQRMNHMNLILRDFEASVEHFTKAFDAEFLVEIPQNDLRACLMAFGDVIFEFFVPNQFLPSARYGPHYVGLEYQADMDQVRAAIAERGIRIVRDIGVALHTDPRDCFGVAFEFYDGSFHELEWDELDGKTMKRRDYWEHEHPMGLTGLLGYSIAVADIEPARAFLESFLGARTVYEEDRPAIGASAIGLQVADDIVELLSPTQHGILARHHYRHGDGIRSTRIGTRDLGKLQGHFASRNIELRPGDADNALALGPEDNLGVVIEFVETNS